ncbi:TPA: DUF4238 domain-containing protein, partial [Legionella pneumophila subsp. pneumophila]|nr:DUF4238 domain-containing protein [Legionella pneumophila subsp. pneumophila]
AVEKYLSKIEHLYDQTINNIKKGEITENDITILKIFLYFQFIRVPIFMSMMQKSFSQVAKWVDDFSRNSDASEEVIDLSKKLIIGGISKDNVILNQASLIFSNNTGQDFLTSDNPVVRKIINWRQTSNLIGRDFLISTYDNSIEKPIFYMPISSNLAFISCDFLDKSGVLDRENGQIYVNQLNIQMCLNADKSVYAENRSPLIDQNSFINHLDNCRIKKNGDFTKIITESDIYYLSDIYDLNREKFKITFKTKNNNFLEAISKGSEIKLIEIHAQHEESGMREAKITSLNKTTGEVIIESNFKPIQKL